MAAQDSSALDDADYVIVGAGSAGCTLASRLTENPAIRVALIEAGGEDKSPLIHMPPGYARTIGNPAFDWIFQAGPEPGLGGRSLPYARGKVLGGSSSINGLAWVWGARADYDRWRDLGCIGWGYDDMVPYLRKAESFAEDWPGRGRQGPVPIALNPGFHAPSRRLFEAAEQAGLPVMRDYNGIEAPLGLARFQLNVAGGRRMSAAATYLKAARGRPNLTVITGAQVVDLAIENGAATGVNIRTGDGQRLVRAAAEVILSAGTIGSPILLERSGIGAGARLQALGLEVRAQSPDVGENVRDHWLVMMKYRLTGLRSFNEGARGLRGALTLLRYLAFRTGPLSGTPTEVNGYARVGEGAGPADVQIMAAPMTYSYLIGKDGKPRVVVDREAGMSIGLYPCRPQATGHVHVSADGKGVDLVAGFLDHPDDQALTVKGLALCRRIMAQSAIARHVVAEIAPGAAADGDAAAQAAALLDYARAGGMPGFHLVSACRMGADARSVVDLQLAVRGVRRLRVVDASVMPDLIGANTHAPTVAIAEKAAELLQRR